jgi:carbonic anhydrase/acetyltransferase-like protein (isoleucine patch superfamily)
MQLLILSLALKYGMMNGRTGFVLRQQRHKKPWGKIGVGFGNKTAIDEYATRKFARVISKGYTKNAWRKSEEINANCFTADFDPISKRTWSHDKNKSQTLTIGSDVWIGAHAFINCSKVKTIGDGAIIGSGAVVIEDVLPYSIVVGVPAKVKRFRYTPEQIETLMRVRWWDWDETAIRDNAGLLLYPHRFFERFRP